MPTYTYMNIICPYVMNYEYATSAMVSILFLRNNVKPIICYPVCYQS